VFNVLLQILDDGRLTDGQGRTVDFKNTVIIMTSNIGGALIHETLARKPDTAPGDVQYEEMERKVLDLLRRQFRPEFLNRVDDVIIFHSLSREQIRDIVDIQLRRLTERLEESKIALELTDEAKDLIASEGYDPAFGARPLKRVIQQKVLDALSMEILEGNIPDGACVVGSVNGQGTEKLAFAVK
jgi:ATP-dependent Clp protease ATP-binding subunit ClpA